MAAPRYLLDTHALIWWWLGDPALSRDARSFIEEEQSSIHITAISGIEIALKVRAGKLPAMAEIIRQFDVVVKDDGFRHLAVTYDHTIKAGLMEGTHRDPFDRIIAAQSLIEEMPVITRDRAFTAFGCKVLW